MTPASELPTICIVVVDLPLFLQFFLTFSPHPSSCRVSTVTTDFPLLPDKELSAEEIVVLFSFT